MTSESIHDVTDVIRSAARTLHDADIDTPEHDAKLLLAEACGRDLRDIDKAMLMGEPLDGLPREHASFDAPDAGAASSDSSATAGNAVTTALARFHAMIARRAAREPLQYITGHAPFRYLDLEVGPGVFIPRTETETVVQAGIDWLTRERLSTPRIVDLCAGSGAIGLSLVTEVRGAQVWAVEKVPRTYDWTMRNWRRISRLDPLAADNYHLELGDATSGTTLAQFDGTIDMVATDHAPHTAEEKAREFAKAPSGITGLETAFSVCNTYLVQPGKLTPMQLVDRMSKAPAEIYGLTDRAVQAGNFARLVLLDWDSEKVYETYKSKGINTPYTGKKLTGSPKAIVTGVKVTE